MKESPIAYDLHLLADNLTDASPDQVRALADRVQYLHDAREHERTLRRRAERRLADALDSLCLDSLCKGLQQ